MQITKAGVPHPKLLLASEQECEDMLKKLKLISFKNEHPELRSGFNLSIRKGEAVDFHESEASLVYTVRSRTARAI